MGTEYINEKPGFGPWCNECTFLQMFKIGTFKTNDNSHAVTYDHCELCLWADTCTLTIRFAVIILVQMHVHK